MIIKATRNEMTAFKADEIPLFNEKINKKITATSLPCNENNITEINDGSINEINKKGYDEGETSTIEPFGRRRTITKLMY